MDHPQISQAVQISTKEETNNANELSSWVTRTRPHLKFYNKVRTFTQDYSVFWKDILNPGKTQTPFSSQFPPPSADYEQRRCSRAW